MPGGSNGLQRDIRLVRRRGWLFIPALVFGILSALGLQAVAGDANATARMDIDTFIQETFQGSERGFRIFEAEHMTRDDAFKQKVLAAIGDDKFNYARYDVELFPISVADGVSRGRLTVSIQDSDLDTARRLRKVFVDVYKKEYLEADGLLRTRFITKKQEVVQAAEREYNTAYQKLKAHPGAANIPIDDLIRPRDQAGRTLLDEYNREDAQLRRQLAEVEGGLALGSALNGRVAGSILGQTVSDAEAQATLQARRKVLTAAIAEIGRQRQGISDGSLPPDLAALIGEVRALAELKHESARRVVDARAAVQSAQSTFELETEESGGLGGSLAGRIAIVIAVTLVFGLIAIYLWEWLSQVRGGLRG